MIPQHGGCMVLNVVNKAVVPPYQDAGLLLNAGLISSSASLVKKMSAVEGIELRRQVDKPAATDECQIIAAALSKLRLSPPGNVKPVGDSEKCDKSAVKCEKPEAKLVKDAKTESKRRSITPKEILQYSREKSHSLAHNTKSISAPLVSKEALTNDLMGVTRVIKVGVNRDKKNVDEMTKALNEFGLQHTVSGGVKAAEGELLPRGPIPVPNHNYRASTAPYPNSSNRPGRSPATGTTLTFRTEPHVDHLAPPQSVDAAGTQPHNHLDQAADVEDQLDRAIKASLELDVKDDDKAHSSDIKSSPSERTRSTDHYRTYHPFHSKLTELPETLSDFILNFSALYAKQNLGVNIQSAANAGVRAAELFNQTQATLPSIVREQQECMQPRRQLAHFAHNMATTTKEGLRLAHALSKHAPTKKAFACVDKNRNVLLELVQKEKEKRCEESEPTETLIQSQVSTEKPLRKLLRDMIGNDELNKAWMWAVRCSQSCSGALYYRDADGDSLLHIVVWHQDLAKVYSLTELMNRENDQSYPKPFDLKNMLNETPLFLAVEKRSAEVVAYGLENSDDPNLQALSNDLDAPLHYAASRGMTDIVEILCHSSLINLNLHNGSGLTPLLCALKNHGRRPDDGGYIVDSKAVIQTLLKAGADLKRLDTVSGKTAFHYAVESMEPKFIQFFRDHYDKESLQDLVNLPCFGCETPLCLLDRIANQYPDGYAPEDSSLQNLKRKEMLECLLDCGAEWPQILASCEPDFADYIYSSFL